MQTTGALMNVLSYPQGRTPLEPGIGENGVTLKYLLAEESEERGNPIPVILNQARFPYEIIRDCTLYRGATRHVHTRVAKCIDVYGGIFEIVLY
jgi:hypothetical protein